MLQKIFDDVCACLDHSLNGNMHRDAVFFEIADYLAELVEVRPEKFMVVVKEEEFYPTLRNDRFESGEEYLFFFHEMNIEMFSDDLACSQERSIIFGADLREMTFGAKPFDQGQEFVARN